MSLINKMLQDLDARGGAREDGLQQRELKAVPPPERERRPLLLVGAGVGVAALAAAAAGWYGWQTMHRATPVPVPVQVMAVATPATAPSATAAAAPAVPTAPAASGLAAEVPTAAPVLAQPAVMVSSAPQGQAGPAAAVATSAATSAMTSATTPAGTAAVNHRPTPTAAVADTAAYPTTGASRQPRQGSARAEAGVTTKPELTPKQLSENTYRRALAALQEGRLSVALADLDRALEIDPRNDAARQTYVSLLLENRRPDDAMRQLRLALGIDPRQPGLAMVLARLQLERGGPALETLMTTLPHAAANADYQGFLAGVLQREQRHAEAARYYQAALKLSPLNGVWWMGLGISMQADQHPAEAREAFTRARTGNGITPELLAFIDRRLDQLARSVPQ